MNKSIKFIFFTLVLIVCSHSSSLGQSITEKRQLSFGTFAAGNGTITVPIAGVQSVTGSVKTFLNNYQSAEFEVFYSGFWKTITHVSVNQDKIYLTGSNGGSMEVNSFTTSNLNGAIGWFVTTKTFNVGGTIVVSTTTKPGAYTGTYRVTVHYN